MRITVVERVSRSAISVTKQSKLFEAVDKQLRKEVRERDKKLAGSKEWVQMQREWKQRSQHVCKPCWELKYCPYGPLVEQFPLPGMTRKEAVDHNEFLKEELKKGSYTGARKPFFEYEVKSFNPRDYPVKIPRAVMEKSCKIFGHLCPVFFVNEPLTETAEMRRVSRTIPREVMLRVVRRDNYTCQKCHKQLTETELEFHHKIPWAKGGSTDENNIQVYCYDCNRSQGSKIPKELSSSPFE